MAAGPAVRSELLALLTAARVEYVNARDVQRGRGLAVRQAEQGRLERETTQLCEYQPAMVPGIVQTAAYARELLALAGGPRSHGASDADIAAMVAARIQRQALLYEPGRRIELVISEAALYSPPGTTATLRGQLYRLAGRGRAGEPDAVHPAAAGADGRPADGRLHAARQLRAGGDADRRAAARRAGRGGGVPRGLRGPPEPGRHGDPALELIQAAMAELRDRGGPAT